MMRSIFLILCACGAEQAQPALVSQGSYAHHFTAIRKTGVEEIGFVSAKDCVPLDNATCLRLPLEQACDYVDLVIARDRQVEVSVCYPARADYVVTDAIPDTSNDTVIRFDPSSDGKPFRGDVVISGNNVSLLGNGLDKTIIDGNVRVEKNNVNIRGVRITGSLYLQHNNAVVVLNQVDGSISSAKNNGLFVANTIGGDLLLHGNNDKLFFNLLHERTEQ